MADRRSDAEKNATLGWLWQRTSAKGNVYMAGKLGGVRVLVLENRDRKDDTEPSHYLVVAELHQNQRGGK